jgi:cytochrome c oxidase subunit III
MGVDVLDKRSRQEALALKNKRLAIRIFQMSWIMVFVCLIVVNLQIRSNFPSWPQEGIRQLGNVIPTMATIVLLISAYTVNRAVKSAETGDAAGFERLWRFTLLLGVAFVAMMAWEWWNAPIVDLAVDPRNPGQQYGAIFRAMTGYHMLHALVIGAYMFSTYQKRAALSPKNYWGAESGANLWYFVVVAWIMFYVVLYWI